MTQLDDLLPALVTANLLSQEECEQLRQSHRSVQTLTDQLESSGRLTSYQAAQIREGQLSSLQIGDYTIIEPLGAGGMGQVFRAKHQHLKRNVAIKLLLYLLYGPWQAPEWGFPQTAPLPASLQLPVLGGTRIHYPTLIIGIVAVVRSFREEPSAPLYLGVGVLAVLVAAWAAAQILQVALRE